MKEDHQIPIYSFCKRKKRQTQVACVTEMDNTQRTEEQILLQNISVVQGKI